MGQLLKYEPEAPGEEYLDKYVHDTRNDNDYVDAKEIYDFEEDLEIAKNRLFGGLFASDESEKQIEEEENDEEFDDDETTENEEL